MTDVSPKQGHASIASPSVNTAPVPFIHHSSPVLFSQYRGPHIYNMAETDEEKAAREEEERKAKEDEEKRSNFQKVKEARDAEKARADAAEAKLKEREEADKKAAEAKLTEEKKFEELAKQKEAEATAKTAEAAQEKARADAAEAKVKSFEDQQEAELTEILKTIPDDKKPPLDEADPVSKRLAQAKYAQTLLETGPKPPVGGGPRKGANDNKGRKAELQDAQKKRLLTEDEAFELGRLVEE